MIQYSTHYIIDGVIHQKHVGIEAVEEKRALHITPTFKW